MPMLHIPRTCPATWSLLFGLISVTAFAALPDRALARDRASHAHLCRAMAEVLFDYSSSEWSMAEHRRERAEKAGQPDAVVAPLRPRALAVSSLAIPYRTPWAST